MGESKVLSRLDYVTGWHAKAITLFQDVRYRGQWAFVTTNSITQGDQPARLFAPIFDAGWHIKFAH
uniref:DNA methyltransferase n=1 Tax=Brachybacterium alimentarium TaxID=47845 RepID=UPI0030B83307